jgi:eukaryotic-like serine/threonine-protein kinase
VVTGPRHGTREQAELATTSVNARPPVEPEAIRKQLPESREERYRPPALAQHPAAGQIRSISCRRDLVTAPPPQLTEALRDRYVLERELGSGGMATVYLAEDVRHHRQVAIKVLRSELAATLGSDRFFREIEVAARLQHPHILPLLDSGETGGFYFYVMPYVAGESLRERLARVGELPVHEAVKILAEVVDALAAAHTAGVVHRDIKPDNVMLSGRHALVMDFGVAKAVSEATGRNKLTTAGVALGTPAYMAPEQAAADPHLDHRVDIYAVGTMGYELLTGHPPFSGGSSQEILAAHMTRAPQPISSRRPAVPPALAAIIMKCLEKRPADRYQTAEELLVQLEPLATPSGGMTPTQTRPVEAVGAKRAPGWMKAVGAIVAGVVVVAAAIFALNRPSGQSARPNIGYPRKETSGLLAVLPFETIGGDTAQRYFSAGMTEEIAGQLSKVSALRVLSRTATDPYRDLPDRLHRMKRDLGVGSVVEGSVRLTRDRVRIGVRLTDPGTGQTVWAEQYDRDLADVFAVQSDVAHRIADALHATLTPPEVQRVDRAPTRNLVAYQLYLRSRELSYSDRTKNLAGIELLRQAIRTDSTFAVAYAIKARRFMHLSWFAGQAYRDSGLVAARKALALQPDLAMGHFALADLRGDEGYLTEARLSYLKALELDPSQAGAMVDLAETERLLGRYDESLYWANRAVPLLGHTYLGYYHVSLPLLQLAADDLVERWLLRGEREWPDAVRLQIQLSWLDVLRGRDAAAMERMRRVVARDPGDDEGKSHLAGLAVLTGAPDAEAMLLPMVQDNPHGRTQTVLPESFGALMGLVLQRRGQHAQAAKLWDEAFAADQEDLARGHENPDRSMEIAAIHAAQGETGAALEWLERAYRAGWRDYRGTRRDPFFQGLLDEARFKHLLSRMEADVIVMRKRAIAASDSLLARTQ